MKKVVRVIINFLTILLFVILLLVIGFKVRMLITGSDCFEIFGYSFFNVATGSMKPTINENDIVIVKKNASYDSNDIVTFKKDGSYITHRVVVVSGDSLITKGDFNNTNDVIISKTDVYGKVIKIVPNGGVWQKTFTSPKVIFMIFVTLLTFDFAFSYKGNKKSSKIDLDKLSREELKIIYDKINSSDDPSIKENLEYTIGLDLTSIQEEIKSRMGEDQYVWQFFY